MSDLISRAAAIDALGEEPLVWHEDDAGEVAERNQWRRDVAAIKALPSAQPECEDAVSRADVDTLIEEAQTARWIPVTERLPKEPYGCLVTVWDTDPVTMDEFENLLPYFVGWDGEQWNDGEGEQCPFEVIAWMPLPTPYREGGTG